MNRNASASAVDRLIALAQEEKPAENASTEIEAVPVLERAGTPVALEQNLMWKALLQVRSVLPYVARALEMTGHAPSTGLSREVHQSVSNLETSHRELRTVVQNQAQQLEKVGEAATRTQQALERNTQELNEINEDLKSIHSLIRWATGVLGVLLLALIGLVIFLAVRVPHLLR